MGAVEKPNERSVSSGELLTSLNLVNSVLTDIMVALNLDLSRDAKIITTRTHSEGFSFLSKTLPLLGSALRAGLETGLLVTPTAFRKLPNTTLPTLLSGLFKHVFSDEGKLKSEADRSIYCRAIEQVCNMYKKYPAPVKQCVARAALQGVIDRDRDLALLDLQKGLSVESRRILNRAAYVVSETLTGLDMTNIRPRFGSGANDSPVANDSIYAKFCLIRSLPEETEKHFPRGQYFVPSPLYLLSHRVSSRRDYIPKPLGDPYYRRALPGKVPIDKWCKRWPAIFGQPHHKIKKVRMSRVCDVPKDASNVRIIGVEQPELQALQSGVGELLRDHIEHRSPTWVRGHINFSSQDINANLALLGSKCGLWCTIDLKDASDLVSLALVRALFEPTWFDIMCAIRSEVSYIRNEDGSITYWPLTKFAPMGSGLCFPVESLVFYALSVGIIMEFHGCSYEQAAQCVYVYGDDIVIAGDHYAQSVIDNLPIFGLKPNKSKCFLHGPFRESCGTDAVDGEIVTPVRVKTRLIPSTEQEFISADSLVSLVDLSNYFHKSGYWRAAETVKRHVESITRAHFKGYVLPVVPKGFSLLGWNSFCGPVDTGDVRWQDEQMADPVYFLRSSKSTLRRNCGFVLPRSRPVPPYYQGKRMRGLRAKPVIAPADERFGEYERYLQHVLQIGEVPSAFPVKDELELKFEWATFT